ncbi:hypothetical protein KCV01_g19981, partial [Aureobasidium melanogenum]
DAGDETQRTDHADGDTPGRMVGGEPRNEAATHATDGVATDVEPHGETQRVGMDLLADVGHRHGRKVDQFGAIAVARTSNEEPSSDASITGLRPHMSDKAPANSIATASTPVVTDNDNELPAASTPNERENAGSNGCTQYSSPNVAKPDENSARSAPCARPPGRPPFGFARSRARRAPTGLSGGFAGGGAVPLHRSGQFVVGQAQPIRIIAGRDGHHPSVMPRQFPVAGGDVDPGQGLVAAMQGQHGLPARHETHPVAMSQGHRLHRARPARWPDEGEPCLGVPPFESPHRLRGRRRLAMAARRRPDLGEGREGDQQGERDSFHDGLRKERTAYAVLVSGAPVSRRRRIDRRVAPAHPGEQHDAEHDGDGSERGQRVRERLAEEGHADTRGKQQFGGLHGLHRRQGGRLATDAFRGVEEQHGGDHARGQRDAPGEQHLATAGRPDGRPGHGGQQQPQGPARQRHAEHPLHGTQPGTAALQVQQDHPVAQGIRERGEHDCRDGQPGGGVQRTVRVTELEQHHAAHDQGADRQRADMPTRPFVAIDEGREQGAGKHRGLEATCHQPRGTAVGRPGQRDAKEHKTHAAPQPPGARIRSPPTANAHRR